MSRTLERLKNKEKDRIIEYLDWKYNYLFRGIAITRNTIDNLYAAIYTAGEIIYYSCDKKEHYGALLDAELRDPQVWFKLNISTKDCSYYIVSFLIEKVAAECALISIDKDNTKRCACGTVKEISSLVKRLYSGADISGNMKIVKNVPYTKFRATLEANLGMLVLDDFCSSETQWGTQEEVMSLLNRTGKNIDKIEHFIEFLWDRKFQIVITDIRKDNDVVFIKTESKDYGTPSIMFDPGDCGECGLECDVTYTKDGKTQHVRAMSGRHLECIINEVTGLNKPSDEYFKN